MNYPVATAITGCRLCGSDHLDTVIDFGTPYISDFLLPGQEGTRAPLHVLRCVDCGLIQMQHTIDPHLLWGGTYWYKSGTNESMVKALEEVAVTAGGLQPGDSVLDIGANDGTLLSFYPDFVRKVAVEPSPTFLKELIPRTDSVIGDYWPTEVDTGAFKRITTIACFYDTSDPHAFVQAIKEALAPGGLWIVQMQDELSVLRDTAFDYFCHEHTCLYSAETFSQLCAEHGLRVITCQANDVNGGSLRFVVGHEKRATVPYPERPDCGPEWVEFVTKAEGQRAAGMAALNECADIGFWVYGLAASTKANTVLQWYGITQDHIQVIVERAPEKIGRVTVGSNIPIIGEDEIRDAPDFYVPLAWHFIKGLRERHPETPFLTLLPDVTVYPALRERVHANPPA